MRAGINSLPVLDRHCQMGLFKTIYDFMQFYIIKLKKFALLDLNTFTGSMRTRVITKTVITTCLLGEKVNSF